MNLILLLALALPADSPSKGRNARDGGPRKLSPRRDSSALPSGAGGWLAFDLRRSAEKPVCERGF